MVEMEDLATGKLYKKVALRFMQRLEEVRPRAMAALIAQSDGGPQRRDEIRRQAEFVGRLSQLAKDLRSSKDARPKKIDKLRAAIHDTKQALGSFPGIPLPLDARVTVTGIDAEGSTVFKSNLFPLRLQLRADDGGHFPVIFKNGDDLRQDQLVIQLFTLMDRLLRTENLDLRLMPYKVLATTAIDGMVQFVPSMTLGAISSEHGTIHAYLRQQHPDEGSVSTYGIVPEVLDTFVRSCGALATGRLALMVQPATASSPTSWASAIVTSTTCCSRPTATSFTVRRGLRAKLTAQSTLATSSAAIPSPSCRPSSSARR